MTARELNSEPKFAPGQGQSELARNAFRIARGPDIASAAGGATGTATVVPLFNVPPNTFVKEIILDITNKWTTSCRQGFTVGDTNDVDRFFTASGASVHSAAGTRTSARSITLAANGGGRFYTAAQVINAVRTCGTKTTATGNLRTYIVYAPNIEYFNTAS